MHPTRRDFSFSLLGAFCVMPGAWPVRALLGRTFRLTAP